jgi:hypothetical protein
VLLGYPGSPHVNVPSPVRPTVPPGRHPVFASLVGPPDGHTLVAFVVVRFEDGPPAVWEEAGSFFTDSGVGCLMDEGGLPALERTRADDPTFWERLDAVKTGVLAGGDGNLALCGGAHAVVFATQDSRYPCYVGRGLSGRPVWLVVDCR